MKLFLLNAILIGMIFTASTQTLPTRFKNCIVGEMYFLTAEVTPEWQEGNKDLITYLNEKLEEYQDLKKANGKVIIEIIIYENGKTCCASFSNMTNTFLNPEVFKEIVNDMPHWKAARQRGKPVVFLKQLVLNINKGEITTEQSG